MINPKPLIPGYYFVRRKEKSEWKPAQLNQWGQVFFIGDGEFYSWIFFDFIPMELPENNKS